MSPRNLSPDAYQALFENSMDAVLLTIPDGRIVAANPAARAMFQMTEAEMCAAGRDRLIDTSDPRFSAYLEEGARLGRSRGELTCRRKDDSTFIGDVSSVLLDQGQRAFVMIRDITECKQREEDLRRAHGKLQATIDSITDGLLVLDRDWRYTYFSETGAKMLGMRREDLIGGCVWELFPHARGTKFHEFYHRAVESGQPAHFEEFYPEPLNRWLDCHCYPSEEGLAVYFRDITERKQREEELRRAHALLEGITNGTEDLIAAQDGEFRYLFFNEAYRREFKSLWGDLEVGTSMIEALAPWPQEQRNAREMWGRALAGESFSTRMEFGSEREQRTYDFRFNPVFDSQGRQIGAAHIVRNVTEEIRIQQALAESEEHARRIIDNTVALVGIMTLDGTLIEANATALRAGGLRREDVVGKKFWDCWWWSYDVQVQAQLRQAVEKAAKGEIVRYDVVVRASGDGRMPIDFMLAPARNSEGQITHLIPSALDITERKRAEEALRESEERFRATFEQVAVGIAHIGLNGRFLRLNRKLCDIVGYSHDELQKRTFMEITHAEDLDRDVALAKRLLRGEIDQYQMEKRYIHRDGHPVWINLTGAVQRAADGSPLFFIAVIEDISARKAIEDELIRAKAAAEEASRAKSEFLANMSHEIRTPMTVFMAAIEHLLQIDRNPDRRQLLTMADQSAGRLRALIDDILDFSRIEARKIDLEEEPFDLGACVRDAVNMFALQAKEKNIRLECEMAPEVPETIVGDSDRLSQVLINLIGNAVKFTHEGEVRVSVQPRGEFVEFAVADTGIGIPEEKRELLFESFTQADSSFTRKFGGTGLGLAISKGLVDLMDGEISVRSREGEGSVFTFTIPLKSAGTQPGVPVEALSGDAGNVSAARILLAEDDQVIRDLISLMLAQRGWKAETAENGREAAEKWERGDFDLVLMDLQMPEMNGLETTRTIRQKESGGEKHTWIIGLTAHARREIRDECLEAGMDRVLIKPIQVNDLYSAISDCLK